MPILVAAVALVALLGLVNLLLLTAVVRRLAQHTTQLAGLRPGGAGPGDPGLQLLPDGTPVPAFTGGGAGLALIAFLSTGCDACQEQLPKLLSYLAAHGIEREAALVVVVGAATDPAAGRLTAALEPAARVLREPLDGPVAGAFGVRMYPTFYLVTDGGLRSGTIAVDWLPEPAAA